MRKHKVIIIDDDSEAVELLKYCISNYFPKLLIINEAQTIYKGLILIKKHKPDIVFMNTIIGGQETFYVLDKLKEISFQIIFMSNLEEYILKAIRYQVLDYILKPIELDQILFTLNRAVIKLEIIEINNLDKELLSKKELDFLAIPTKSKVKIVKFEDIIYCEAKGGQTIFHLVNGTKFLSTKNIGIFEIMLKEINFFRIHNSYIVNLNMVKYIDKSKGNTCKLLHGISLPISSRRNLSLSRFLKLR